MWGPDQQRGEYLDPDAGKIPFGELTAEWLTTTVHLKPKTRVDYECALNVHVLPAFATVPVGPIGPQMVRRYVADFVAKGVSPARVRKACGMLKLVLDMAVEAGAMRSNPCVGVKLPAMRRHPMRFLTASQVAAVALAIEPPYDLLVKFAAYTGLRAGEIAALRARHVDLDRGTVLVESALSEVRGQLEEGDPKTYSSRRAVGLPAFLVEALGRHVAGLDPNDHVFSSPDGGPLRHQNFYKRRFKPAVHRALPEELHGLRFHDLRHTCAALLIAEGAHPKPSSSASGTRRSRSRSTATATCVPRTRRGAHRPPRRGLPPRRTATVARRSPGRHGPACGPCVV